jgi:hypothetical protein
MSFINDRVRMQLTEAADGLFQFDETGEEMLAKAGELAREAVDRARRQERERTELLNGGR